MFRAFARGFIIGWLFIAWFIYEMGQEANQHVAQQHKEQNDDKTFNRR